jgi:branched-chain amino acid transport system ATP-binding protein
VSPILHAQDISVAFGAVQACDEITLEVHEGEILGLIGPNGSGKSTFMNAITGVVPASGSVTVAGTGVPLGKPGDARTAGMVRAYQTPQNFMALSCIDNVCLSDLDRAGSSVWEAAFRRPTTMRHERRRWSEGATALDRVGLLELAESPASLLTYGQQRLLELARGMAGNPIVLLLDEPSAGLNQPETDNLADLLIELGHEGLPMLLVDHKIDFLDRLCDRLVVLQEGRVIASGETSEVWADQAVVDAYLGVGLDD